MGTTQRARNGAGNPAKVAGLIGPVRLVKLHALASEENGQDGFYFSTAANLFAYPARSGYCRNGLSPPGRATGTFYVWYSVTGLNIAVNKGC